MGVEAQPAIARPTFREAFRFWAWLGFVNFGGPSGQIALMHRELVDKRGWIQEDRFLHALNFCMLLPGPEAMQLAVYVGWLLHGTLGGVVAGVCFVLPSVFVLLALSWAYAALGSVPLVAGLLLGLKAAVLAIVAHAVLRLGRRALRGWPLVAIAAGAFVALAVGAPFPLVVLAAGLAGYAGSRLAPRLFPASATPLDAGAAARRVPLGRVLAWGGALWLAPLALLVAVERGTLADVSLFFSGAALVTFGGAYAVLAFVAQAAVERHGWLTAGQMVDGLGLAESTPGPLIMVVGFVGFMAGWTHPGALPPAAAGALGLLAAVYFTFLPSFLFIFAGAPHVEALRGRRGLHAALSAITAAVVGVILHLAVYFGEHVLLPGGALAGFPLVVAGFALFALTVLRMGVLPVVLLGAGLGLGYALLG